MGVDGRMVLQGSEACRKWNRYKLLCCSFFKVGYKLTNQLLLRQTSEALLWGCVMGEGPEEGARSRQAPSPKAVSFCYA